MDQGHPSKLQYPPDHPLAGFHFLLQFVPRFSDLDPWGHVHNVDYFTYLEEGRVAYLRWLDILLPPSSMISVVLQQAECQYIRPVHHHHLVEVHLRTCRWGNKSFSFEYALWLPEEDTLAAKAHTRMVCYDLASRRTVVIPPLALKAMQDFEAGLLEPEDSEEE